MRSRDKRKARQHKDKTRRCETNVSNVGGLFIFGDMFKRAEDNLTLDVSQTQKIKLAAYFALDQMIQGQSTSNDWGMIAGSINTAMILAEQGYGEEHIDIFIRAQEALTRSYERGMRTNAWRFDGAGLQDIKTALQLHDQQCDIVTRKDITNALNEVSKRIDDGNTYQIEGVGV